ncbi:cytochrome-c peroxidase [Lysobacter gummosus]|uniref:cytochrome-c peroxidase n=1 Tax=Lysobacter gummosus TaxID=262324 RepID=UPI0036263522
MDLDAEVTLGQKIFHDPTLSADGRISCASCHLSSQLFADGKAVSKGVHGQLGTRNSPSLLDVSRLTSFFWDGRESKLESAVLQPFSNPREMGQPDIKAVVRQVNADARYGTFRQVGFGNSLIDEQTISSALSAYLRSLKSGKSRYDRYAESRRANELSPEEHRGLILFQGKAACADCHRIDGIPATFTDQQFHHTGVGFEQVAGNVGEMTQRLTEMRSIRQNIGILILSDRAIAELGRFAATNRPGDLGAFRTPSLRNVALTAPYMHDGSIGSLKEAVEREIYYRSLNRGRPISLTVEEQRQLIAFLETLSEEASTAAK